MLVNRADEYFEYATDSVRRALRCAMPAGCGLVLTTTVAQAQPSAADAALAETLFQDAQRLMQDGDYALACPKLAESQRLDPGTGTLLNLARCYERQGRTASAWTRYHEALAAAHRDGRTDRVAYAEQHIAALEPKLSRLVITVDPQAPEGVHVTLDSVTIGRAAWSTAAPVDPGTHRVQATAPGHTTFSTEVVIEADSGKTVVVKVPPLELDPPTPDLVETTPAPEPAPTATPAPPAHTLAPEREPEREPDRTTLVLGYGLGGLGLAALGVGTYFGMRAVSRWDDRNLECDASGCSQDGVDAGGDAEDAALVADITIPAGVVLAGVGGYLLYSAYSGEDAGDTSTAVRLEPVVGPAGAWVTARGAF